MTENQWAAPADDDADDAGDADAKNFYAPPTADVGSGLGGSGSVTSAERVRTDHIKHEASVKSIGCLYYLGAAGLLVGGIGVLAAMTSGGSGEAAGVVGVFGVVYLGLGLVYFATAFGLRRLQPWSRIVGTIFAAIGLLGFPIGTVVSIYILYLLLSSKGSTVFSAEYKDVIAKTPHIKYKPSIIVYIFLGLLVLLLIAIVVGAWAG